MGLSFTKLKPDCKKACVYTILDKCEEIIEKIYSEFTDDEGNFYKHATLPRKENRKVFITQIKDETTSNELEKDIKKIKPDYIFFGEITREYKHKLEILEFFKKIAKENNILVFVLFRPELRYDFSKCLELSDINLSINSLEKGNL